MDFRGFSVVAPAQNGTKTVERESLSPHYQHLHKWPSLVVVDRPFRFAEARDNHGMVGEVEPDGLPDPLILLADVPKLKWLPTRKGKRLSLSTIHRWVRTGVGGVRLRTVRVGTALATSNRWLVEFFETLADPAPAGQTKRTPRQREAAREKARRELEEAGI